MIRFITFSILILSSLGLARAIAGAYSHVPSTTATSYDTIPTSSCRSNSSDPQTSLTLLSSLIAPNFAHNGLHASGSNTSARQVASLTSTNNFINWCASVDLPITNGQQIPNGSCNPAPMGAIPAATKMPSSKFVTPHNLAIIPPNTTFKITLAVKNFVAGWFVNLNTDYFGAPQQLDPTTGFIRGHVHVVVQALESLVQTTPTDPTTYTAFVPLNEAADANGYLHANVTGGLAKGIYKMSTIMTSSNHQPLALPVAMRGTSEDMVYLIISAY